ncbi:MAG: hypothetical protein ACFFAS_19310 [Promethearchaeota archaeon]
MTFIISKRGYASKNVYGGSSTIACGVLLSFFGIFNLFYQILPYPFNGFMVWWVGIVFSIYMLFAFLIKKTIKKIELERKENPDMETSNLSPFKKYILFIRKENPYKEKISIKMELVRKSFHSTALLVLLAYYGFFFIPPLTQIVSDGLIIYINQFEAIYTPLWGDISLYPYDWGDVRAVIDLTMFALIAALYFMILSDLIRILWGPEYSIFNLLTKSILRNKEYNAIGPQIYLICGIILSYLFYMIGFIPASVALAAITISCLSDALAALIGRRYGKHKVTCIGGDKKTIEGFIAGSGSAFIFALFFVNPFYALIIAIIFFILDYFPLIIADNVLNPIMISVFVGIISLLVPIPIGY